MFRVVFALIQASLPLPHVRLSKTVLDSGFHAEDSGFQVMDPKYIYWQQYSHIEIKIILISVIGWLSASIHEQTLDSKALADLANV